MAELADKLSGAGERRLWIASQALNRPLVILGCERIWFVLNGMLAYALYTATASITPGLLFGLAGWGAGVLACREDPRMLQVVREAQRYRARYDPAKPGRAREVRLV